MGNMIERMAKAAYEVRAKVYGFEFDWDRAGASRKDHYRAEMRAAVEAMRHPTPVMKSAIASAVGNYDIGHEAWHRGIDAVLAMDV